MRDRGHLEIVLENPAAALIQIGGEPHDGRPFLFTPRERIPRGVDCAIRIRVAKGGNFLEKAGLPTIVRIEEGYQLLAGFHHAPIAGRRDTLVILVHHPDARVFGRLNHLRPMIGGPVVYHDYLEVLDRLVQNRAYRAINRLLLVV